MYPNNFFSLIPPFPRTKRVFVAMSFDHRFDARWTSVLEPAIRDLRHDNHSLEPFRVDLSKASDAILTEILAAVADSHCIVADISRIGQLDGKPVRNANVLYEVGLAHAVRLPEEVVLFRSDTGPLDFDVAGVRVHSYDPDGDPGGARQLVTETVVASLAALDSRRRTSLRAARERISLPALFLLFEAAGGAAVRHPSSRTMGDVLGGLGRASAITLLLELGAIRSQLLHVTPRLLQERGNDPELPILDYALTPFGDALVSYVTEEMGLLQTDIRRQLEALVATAPGDGATQPT